MYRLLLLVVILFLNSMLYSNQPLVRNFTRYDYKSGTQNWAIAQDSSNVMFFANNAGLLKFDGKNWMTFPIVNRTNVRSLLYSKDGLFYASTFNEFGYFKIQKNGNFKYFSLINKLSSKPIGSNELYNIVEGNEKIYFQSEKSIYKYDGDTVVRLPFNYKIDASAYIYNVFFLTSSQNGVFMLNGNLFIKIPGSELLQNKRVCAILPFKDNKILFVTSFNGVYVYDGILLTPYNTGIDNFLKENQVFCATTNAKQLVFGTVQRGIAIQNINDRTVTYVNTFTGLQNNTVLSAKFDNQQNLWLGLDKGIDYVVLNSPISNLFGANNLYGAGYTSIQKNNVRYFGTNQGLYTTTNSLLTNTLPLKLELMKGMEGQVWSLTEIDNTLFCGNDQGAFIVTSNRVEKIDGLLGTWTFKALVNKPDLILGCSYQGLFILKKIKGKWLFSHYIKGKFNEASPMFEEDADGTLWFSHWQKGLFHLRLNNSLDSIIKVDSYTSKNGFPSNQNNTVFKVDNNIVFSTERGFFHFNKAKQKMETAENWNNLFNSPPGDIRLHESPNGDVWCLSGRFIGLARKKANSYSMDSLSYRIVQPKIIIGFEHFNFLDKEHLILSTEDGFCLINTNYKSTSNKNFKVLIRNVNLTNDTLNYSKIKHSFGDSKPKDAYFHKYNSLRFEFNEPEYRSEGLVQYSYMLENYDDQWSEYSFDNIKEYTKLPKGNYVFKVRAKNILEKNEVESSYSFRILSAWYESQLAIIIYIILLLAIIFLLILWINSRSKKGAKEMEIRKEFELKEQKKHYEAETSEKKKEIKELKNQQLQYELRHKSQELASSTMNLIRKNEMLLEILNNISKVSTDLKANNDHTPIISRLKKMERNIRQNIEQDDNWKKFEENFDLIYENYLKRLEESFPEMTVSDKKLCAYLKMDLTSKDIAQLMNMTIRSIEMNRYRLRKKMGLDRDVNLANFLQKF